MTYINHVDDNDDETDNLSSHNLNSQSSIPLNLQEIINTHLNFVDRERASMLQKLMDKYQDKFWTEGISDYRRRRDELDEIFMERMESVKIEARRKDDE